MDIDIREVIDYCRCPMYYKFKYQSDDIKTQTINVLEKYEVDIHRTLYSFFSLVQNGEPVGLINLKRTWGSLWIGSKSAGEVLYADPASWRDTHNEKRKKGITTIVNFYDRFKDKIGFPIAVNKRYRVLINKGVYLTGAFEVIREVSNKDKSIIEIIDFKVDDKQHNKLNIDKDLEITAASYAFRKTFNTVEDRILHYGLDKNKVNYTNRNEEDYKMLAHTVKCVAISIHNKLFYACPDSKCYSCTYKPVCINSLNYENMI